MVPALDINVQSDLPIYLQVFKQLKDSISSGKLPKGTRLPPTRELAGLLGLNRTTISAAYEMLESDGLISGQVGRGSYVTGGDAPAAGEGLNWRSILEASHVPLAPPIPAPAQDAISFAVSRPSEELFPVDDFRASCEEVMAGPDFGSVLQLGSPGGYEPLRQYLLEAARAEGVLRPGDDIMITSGCQQALDIVRRGLIRPGDEVLIE